MRTLTTFIFLGFTVTNLVLAAPSLNQAGFSDISGHNNDIISNLFLYLVHQSSSLTGDFFKREGYSAHSLISSELLAKRAGFETTEKGDTSVVRVLDWDRREQVPPFEEIRATTRDKKVSKPTGAEPPGGLEALTEKEPKGTQFWRVLEGAVPSSERIQTTTRGAQFWEVLDTFTHRGKKVAGTAGKVRRRYIHQWRITLLNKFLQGRR
jgi:hypothetical protein